MSGQIQQLENADPNTLSLEERVKNLETITKMWMGYMRGKRAMAEADELLKMAEQLGGEVVTHVTDYPKRDTLGF